MARTRIPILRAIVASGAAGFAVAAYVYLTLPDVRSLADHNPESTAFMELREAEAAADGRELGREQRWVPYARIAQSLKRAVLVAEDDAFWDHEGVDFEQIRESMLVNWEEGRAIRGASTITQQLAKNLYLSPSRNPVRKLRELIIARRLEAALSKTRILEIYLNVIEWGDGIWGVEAAARTYFGVPASELNAAQSALLAGAIVNPRVLNPGNPTARLRSRQKIILSRMGSVRASAPEAAASEPAAPESTASEPASSEPAAFDPTGDGESAPAEGVPAADPEPIPAPQPFPEPDAPAEPGLVPVPAPFPMPESVPAPADPAPAPQ